MSRYQPNYQQTCAQSDILSNCESYISKLMKPKKPLEKPKPKTSHRPATQMQLARMNTAKTNIVPFIKTNKVTTNDELIHKEVINNKMAHVEVTVRTVSTRSQANSVEKREPWAKLLNTNQEGGNNRKNIDYALSTLHYLSKELQKKLQTTSINDPNINQLINDIQNVLYRLGPEISCMSVNQERHGEGDENYTVKNEQVFKNNQTTQTEDVISDKEVNFEEFLRIQNKCKKVETNLEKLHVDKEKVAKQLKLEREYVEKLKKEMSEQMSDRNEKTLKLLRELREERENLIEEIKDLKSKKTHSDNPNMNELHNKIKEMESDNSSIEYENLKLKYELTVMKLEKEKMTFLLDSKEKQLKSLKSEMENIQSIVYSQLLDLKPEYVQSVLSKTSLDSWKPTHQYKMHRKDQPVHELFMNKNPGNVQSQDSETVINDDVLKKDAFSILKSKMDINDEYPQRDVPATKTDTKKYEVNHDVLSDMTLNSENPDSVKEDLETNIRDMFDELKRQALAVTMKKSDTNNENE